MLHGSGVVCGLDLKGKIDGRSIEITPGLAFDCSGNEIWVQKNKSIDLASLLPPKNKPKGTDDCRKEDEDDGLKTYYIGIRYEEKPTNPVSVYLPSGGCEERSCENSRYKEGYCVEIVECCFEKTSGLIDALCKCEGQNYQGKFDDPCGRCGEDPSKTDNQKKGYAQQDPEKNKEWCRCMTMEEFCEQSVPCSECCSCETPCHVILGQIKIDPEKCVIKKICMNECRRYVLTGRFVQQTLLRIFGGASGYFKMADANGNSVDLPENLEEYIYNPIKALCWWLPYKLEQKELTYLGCAKAPPPQTTSPEVIVKKVDELTSSHQETLNQLNNVINENRSLRRDLNALLENQGMSGTQTTAPTQTSPKAKK
jgi:hypothetical protein